VAELLVYKEYKVTDLRLYFDRLQIVNVIAKGVIEKFFVNMINKKFLKILKYAIEYKN
jgi:hypothetical protein